MRERNLVLALEAKRRYENMRKWNGMVLRIIQRELVSTELEAGEQTVV